MDNIKAIQVLINVAQIAQKAGALSLEDAVIVKQAIDVFVKPPVEPKIETGEEKKEEVIEDEELNN